MVLIYCHLNTYILMKIKKKYKKNDLNFVKNILVKPEKLGFWKELAKGKL